MYYFSTKFTYTMFLYTKKCWIWEKLRSPQFHAFFTLILHFIQVLIIALAHKAIVFTHLYSCVRPVQQIMVSILFTFFYSPDYFCIFFWFIHKMPPTHPYKSNKNKVVSTHNKQISQQSVSYYYISSFYVNISHYIQEKETM